ncbi:MAG: hypothetical protein IJR84_02090 [Bacteroidaceae bacterium]|nr:hypothetical protein [Bacteroidaceae bacterium]
MVHKNNYSSVNYPTPDGKSTHHRPRRNYWGNLYDEDTYDEERHKFNDYGSALYDSEDDHDSYYESGGYD